MCAQSTLPATCLIYLPNAPGLVIRDRDAMVGVGSIGITKTADGSHRLHWVMQKETGRFMMMESASAESRQASMMNVMQADGSVVQSASHSAMSAALENMYRSEHNVSGKYVATKIEDGGITHVNALWEDTGVLAARLSAEKNEESQQQAVLPPPPPPPPKKDCCTQCCEDSKMDSDAFSIYLLRVLSR